MMGRGAYDVHVALNAAELNECITMKRIRWFRCAAIALAPAFTCDAFVGPPADSTMRRQPTLLRHVGMDKSTRSDFQHYITSSISSDLNILNSIPAYLLPLLTVFTFPFIAAAIDHPVDHALLGIPIPVPDPRYFVSGGLCAALSHGVTTPIDVVKTRIQSEPEVFNEGIVSATKAIVSQDGVGALLGGLGPTVVGYAVEGAMKFGLYESLKPTFAQFLPTDDVAVAYLGASVVAGAAASLLLCPMEHTRIRLVTEPSFAKGLIDGLPRIIQEEGWEGVFSGFPAMLSKQVPYTMTKQVSFDIFAGMLYSAAAALDLAAASVKLEVEIGAAFLASILSCISSQPGDVILTDTYKLKTLERSDFSQVVKDVYNEQGFAGFFSGLTARFLQVGTIITSQLVLYDIVKQLLGLPATGSH